MSVGIGGRTQDMLTDCTLDGPNLMTRGGTLLEVVRRMHVITACLDFFYMIELIASLLSIEGRMWSLFVVTLWWWWLNWLWRRTNCTLLRRKFEFLGENYDWHFCIHYCLAQQSDRFCTSLKDSAVSMSVKELFLRLLMLKWKQKHTTFRPNHWNAYDYSISESFAKRIFGQIIWQ